MPEERLRNIDRGLRRRLRRQVPGDTDRDLGFELLVEAPPQAEVAPLWRFWLWLIDEKPGGSTGPSGGPLWRLKAYLTSDRR